MLPTGPDDGYQAKTGRTVIIVDITLRPSRSHHLVVHAHKLPAFELAFSMHSCAYIHVHTQTTLIHVHTYMCIRTEIAPNKIKGHVHPLGATQQDRGSWGTDIQVGTEPLLIVTINNQQNHWWSTRKDHHPHQKQANCLQIHMTL
jgi:hypothetical protein